MALTSEQIGILRGMIGRHGTDEPSIWMTVNNSATTNYALLAGFVDRGWMAHEEAPADALALVPEAEAFRLTDLGAVEIAKLLVDEPVGDELVSFGEDAVVPTSALAAVGIHYERKQ